MKNKTPSRESYALIRTLTGHIGTIDACGISPDGSIIVSGCEGEMLNLWDAVFGWELHNLSGHTKGVSAVAFSPDGDRVVSVSYERTFIAGDTDGKAHIFSLITSCKDSKQEKNEMTETYNWSNFYNALCKLGPQLLLGIDNSTLEMIEEGAMSTDMFWSDGLQEILTENSTNGDLRAGVLSVLDKWRENVLQAIENDFGIELNWKSVSIDSASPLIDELVEAAQTTG